MEEDATADEASKLSSKCMLRAQLCLSVIHSFEEQQYL